MILPQPKEPAPGSVGRPSIWTHAPAGVSVTAPRILHALSACQPGERLMHGWREVGRIGRTGIPLPTFHYRLDDECSSALIGQHGEVFRKRFTWAGMVQGLQPVRLIPPKREP